jgi:hypothetical protein
VVPVRRKEMKLLKAILCLAILMGLGGSALAEVQHVSLFCPTDIEYAPKTGLEGCRNLCAQSFPCNLDSYTSKGWVIASSSPDKKIVDKWETVVRDSDDVFIERQIRQKYAKQPFANVDEEIDRYYQNTRKFSDHPVPGIYGCSCLGTQYTLRKQDDAETAEKGTKRSSSADIELQTKQIELFRKETELLRKENEMLNKENAALKSEIEQLKKNAGTKSK